MNLGFGYGRGVPDNVHTAWGARLIVTQDGTTDLLPDRQDLVFKDETARSELIEWLNGDGIVNVRDWIAGLLRRYTMDTRKSEEFTTAFVDGGRAAANTNASAGYCYVAVWLDKHADSVGGFTHTYPAAAFDADGEHVGPGPWLDVVRKANGLHDGDGIFGAPRYDDDRPGVEIYDDAEVSHDLPHSPLPPLPERSWGNPDYDRVVTERERLRAAWLRDPRNTVTITSKTPLGERLLAEAHNLIDEERKNRCPS